MAVYYFNMYGFSFICGLLTSLLVHKRKISFKKIYWYIITYISIDNLIWGFQYLIGNRRFENPDNISYTIYIIPMFMFIMIGVLTFSLMLAKVSFIEEERNDDNNSRKKNLYKIFFIGAILLLYSLRWMERTFNVDLNAIINTLGNDTAGMNPDIVLGAVAKIIPGILVYLPFVFCASRVKGKNTSICVNNRMYISGKACSRIVGFIPLFIILFVLLITAKHIKLVQFIVNHFRHSEIYEEYYVDPKTVSISGDGDTKNVIILYLESMETTTMNYHEENGTIINCMPNLTQIAKENTNFSHTSGIGGYYNSFGTNFTKAATVATTTGLPIATELVAHEDNSNVNYLEITALGDILDKNDYIQEIMKGSDTSFANTNSYYKKHGNHIIFDLDDFYEKKYVPDGFFEWWGVRDEILFKAAKDEITKLAENGKKFAFSFYTVDMHPSEGYICEICESRFNSKTANVILCTDTQVGDFVDWCKAQEWFDDTVIVIIGDHVRMDMFMTGGKSIDERRVYNCIINSSKKPIKSTQNRVVTTEDFFPTILSAMGFDIEGNRLGIGTDLFSDKKTVAEIYGIEKYNEQLSMKTNMLFSD